MAKEATTSRGSSSSPGSDGHAEEEEEENGGVGLPDYESLRLARIKENQARLEALGLPRLASSLALCSPSKRRLPTEEDRKKRTKRKSRRKGVGSREEEDGDTDDDELYRPSDEDIDEDEEGEECRRSSSSQEEIDKEEENRKSKKVSSGSLRKANKKASSKVVKASKSVKFDGRTRDTDSDEETTALRQAIALSLSEMDGSAPTGVHSTPSKHTTNSSSNRKNEKIKVQENTGRRKAKSVKSRLQLTEDEVVAHFFSFDEVGKGYITIRDIQKMAIAHDFCWKDSELTSMILAFDSDKDGKLSLEDFRTIVCCCKMLQDSGDP